jgi:hypothetical protein
MDYFTKNKIAFWSVMVLIVLNVLMLSTVWFGRRRGRPPGGHRQEALGGMKILEETLGLSPDQVEAFERIRKGHFERTRHVNDRRHKIRIDIVNELFVEKPDSEKIERMLSELKDVQGEFNNGLFRHFEELRDQCTDDQKQELKSMFIHLLEATRPGEQGPQGHRPPMDPMSRPGPPPPPR